jgi:hypothetical protein
MLASALFYVALLAVAAMTFLSAGLAMTRVSASRIAQSYLAVGYQRAMSVLEQRLSAQIVSAGSPLPFPTFTPLPPECAGAAGSCAYTTGATIALTGATNPAAPAGCDPAKSNCAQNEQASAYVDEGRVAARITVNVIASGGMQVATRSSDVVLRTIATPPYLIVASAHDDSSDALSTQAAGDDGGTPAATPNPCSIGASGTADDTTIRVAYQNASTNACTDGSAWRSNSYDLRGSAPTGWSP